MMGSLFGVGNIGTAEAILNSIQEDSVKEATTAREQFDALDHAEMREDTAIQRRVADMEAAGINPVLAASTEGASSTASANAVYSNAQAEQASASKMQAIASLLSSAAMLFLTKGAGLPALLASTSLDAANSAKKQKTHNNTTYVNHAYYIRK